LIGRRRCGLEDAARRQPDRRGDPDQGMASWEERSDRRRDAGGWNDEAPGSDSLPGPFHRGAGARSDRLHTDLRRLVL